MLRTRSGDISESRAFSAKNMRSDFLQRFANLIQVTESSSGSKTNDRT